MDEIKKLTFVNEINGVAYNLIKWLKAQLKQLSELEIEFKKSATWQNLQVL